MLRVSKTNFKISLDSHLLIPLFATILRVIPLTADLSYLIIAAYALLGKRQIIESLFLSWLFSLLNSEIAPYAGSGSVLRYVILLACFFSIILRTNYKKIDGFAVITAGLGVFVCIHAVFFSQISEISILKALNWTFVMLTLLLTWNGMNSLEYEKTLKWVMQSLFIIVLISLLLLLLSPNTGYKINSALFQGILNHPQALGLAVASLGALLIGQLFDKGGFTLLLSIKILICITLIILSGSRTAGFALFFALIISTLIFSTNLLKETIIKKKFSMYILLFFTIIFLSWIFSFEIQNLLSTYISKSQDFDTVDILSVYKRSREVLYAPMTANIVEYPMTGIGFGLGSEPLSMNVKYFKGIPISAPIEKGILPLMVLEEIGIFGFLFFLIWILILSLKAIAISFSSTLILLTILLLNLGEAGLFSPNGFGMLYLILITMSITLPKINKKY
jgi:hypothetical protein